MMREIISTDSKLFTDTTWIEQLALNEVNMEETGVIHFQKMDPNSLMEKSSIEVMDDLRDLFETYINTFNEHRNKYGAEHSIKMFKISDTVNDFMLFRNSLKLIVARRAADTISIGFLSNSGGLRAAKIIEETLDKKIHDIRAHMGSFGHISWKFQGDDVHFPSLVKHYMTEFIQLSAR